MQRAVALPAKAVAALLVALLLVGALPSAALASTGSIDLSPTSGAWGTQVDVTGAGWSGNRVLSLTFGGVELKTCSTSNNGALGKNACVFNVPNSDPGVHAVALTDTVNPAFTRSANFTVTLTQTLNPTSGPAGTVTAVGGTGFRPSTAISFTFDGQPVDSAAPCNTTAAGAFSSCQITVPAATTGPKPIAASDGVRSSSLDFTMQVTTGSLTLGTGSSRWGVSVTPTGSGWPGSRTSANPILIAFDGAPVGQCTTTSGGNLTCPAFVIPDKAPATYQATATDSMNHHSVRTVDYVVLGPTIGLSPASGPGNTVVAVSGSGFAAGSPVTFTVSGDPATPAPTCTTTATGSFSSCQVTVPLGTAGDKPIVARDADERAASANYNLQFQQGTMSLGATSGNTGTSVTVSGGSWPPGLTAENGVQIRFDGSLVKRCATSSGGSTGAAGTLLSCSFNVPALLDGQYPVTAMDPGNSFNTATQQFTVNQRAIQLSSGSGGGGSKVQISGHGFRADKSLQVLFDGAVRSTTTPCSTNEYGVFSGCELTVPNVEPGTKSVLVRDVPDDGQQRAASAAYSVVKTGQFTATPNTGVAGTTVTLTGSGWTPNRTGGTSGNGTQFRMEGELLVTCGTDANGAILSGCTFRVPPIADGFNTVDAVDGENPYNDHSRSFTVLPPAITVTPNEGGSGSNATISGTGFRRNAALELVFDGTVTPFTCTTGEYGDFSNCQFVVPGSATKGSKTVVVRDLPSGTGRRSATASYNLTTSIALAPTRGTTLTTVAVSGDGFNASETVVIKWGGITGTTLDTCGSTSTGTLINCDFVVPVQAAQGTYMVTAEVTTGSPAGSRRNAGAPFTVVNASSMAVAPAEGTYGGTVPLSATLSSPGTNVSGKTVTFRLNGTVVGTATTDADGVAGLPAASLAGIAAHTSPYANGITATFAGDGTHMGASATSALTVNRKTVTGSFTAADKQYDATEAGTITSRGLSGRADGDTASSVFLTGGTATFQDKTIGTGKTVTGTGFDLDGTAAGNYILDSSTLTTTASITQKALTVGFDATSREYDGTTDAAVTPRTLTGLVGADSVSVSGGTGQFLTKNVGNGKTVNVTGYTLTGTDAGNYSYNATAATSANITPRSLTVSATGVGRVYDGTTIATVNLTSDKLSSDTVELGYSGASFANKNAGENKPVSVSGITKSGADAVNYTLTATTASTTANITKRDLTVSAQGVNKTYDSSAVATVNLTDNRVSGDVLATSYGEAVFNTKNAGTNKQVTVSGINVTGTDAGNYSWNTGALTSANINKRDLSVSMSAESKTYDGNANATVALSSTKLNGDVVNIVSSPPAFSDKHHGDNKTVTATGIEISGTDAGNYNLTNTTAQAFAHIHKRALVVSATATSKEYDGLTTATVSLSNNRVSGDDVVVSAGPATFADKHVGSGKTVTVPNITISGTDAGNYTHNTTATTTAGITRKALTIGATGIDKVYNGFAAASVEFTDNRVPGDVLTATGSAAFANKHVGTNKSVSVSAISISGADAGNYTHNTTATTSASISPRALVISAHGIGKVYDGTAAATVTYSDNRVFGDTLSFSGTATYANKAVGENKPVTVSSIAVSGADAGNYTHNTTATTVASISKRNLTVAAQGIDKVYNGNTIAEVTLSTGDRQGSDSATTVALGYTAATFNNKSVGENKPVSVSGISISGSDAANYNLVSTTATTTASITPADGLVVTFEVADKDYDGSTSLPNTSILSADIADREDMIAEGDDVRVDTSKGTLSFADNAAGTHIVTWTGVQLTGANAGNYSLASAPPTTLGTIDERAITGSFAVEKKTYDGTTGATITENSRVLTGVLEADLPDVALEGGTAQFALEDVGTHAVSAPLAGFTLSGDRAANYILSAVSAPAAQITRAGLTVTAEDKSMIYANAVPKLTSAYSGFAAGEGPGVLGGSLSHTLTDRNGATVTPSTTMPAGTYSITPRGLSSSNYSIQFVSGQLSVGLVAGAKAYRPNGMISLKAKSGYVGETVYNKTGTKQTVSGAVRRGTSRTFHIRVRNDGARDMFAVKGTGSKGAFKVSYFDGSKQVTNQVVKGTYRTPVVGVGKTRTLRAVVTVGSKAKLNSSHTLTITAISTARSTSVDAVRAIATAKK